MWDRLCVFVFTEVGKNINQDKALSLKRYVEDYEKHAKSLNSRFTNADANKEQRAHQRFRKIKSNISSQFKKWTLT